MTENIAKSFRGYFFDSHCTVVQYTNGLDLKLTFILWCRDPLGN